MKTRRLLFVGAYPPPYGGIASHLYELLPRLVKNGYEVVSLTPSSDDQILQSPGMKNIFFSTRKYFFRNMFSVLTTFIGAFNYRKDMKWIEFLKVINFSRAIVDIIQEERVDAVFIYDNYNGLVIPILKEYFRCSTPIAFMIFGDFYLYPDKYRAISEFLKNVFIDSDIILSSSQYCADSISKILDYNFPVRVIYVGVDHDVYVPTEIDESIRLGLGIPQNSIVFFSLGRMTKNMGVDFILQTAGRLLNLNSNIYLIVAGAQGDLSMQVKELSDIEPRIKYCPDVPFARKLNYFAASDIFIAPTMEKHACMGVAIKEAMACGKPIIASGSGGIPEAIEDGVNGYLIPIKDGKLDEEVFLDRAKRLLNDPLLRIKMGEKGREKLLELFTNDQTVRQYIEIIEMMLQSKARENRCVV